MKKRMQDYKELTQKLYPVPKSVQELIPIHKISEDGIFLLENKPKGVKKQFDKAYLFLDTNFDPLDEEEQKDIFKMYCSTLNSLNTTFKVVIMNINQNMKLIRETVFIKNEEPEFEELVASFNAHMERSLLQGRCGIEQVRIFVLTYKAYGLEEARDYFQAVEANLKLNFDRMKSGLYPLSATQRLKYLHAFYRKGEEENYQFEFNRAKRRGIDWRDVIAPMAVKQYQDGYGEFDGITLQIGEQYVRAFYVPELPNVVDTKVIKLLTEVPFHIILSIDTTPIPKEVSQKRLAELYMQTGRSIEKQQETRNRNGAWASDISYELKKQQEQLEEYQDLSNENDEKLFYQGLYAVIIAESKKELESTSVSFCSIAQGQGFLFKPALWEQIDVINTALPVGCRFCDVMTPLFTQPLAAFIPFVVSELQEMGGIFYGINQISKNTLIGQRKWLKNGNGFVIGITGGGKGMDVKQEIAQVTFCTDDDVVVVDLQNEYRDIVRVLNGQFIDFGAEEEHYINPLSTDTLEYMESKRAFLRNKTELMLGIFAQIMDEGLTAQHRSVIGRCVKEIYEGLGKKGFVDPTLVEFYAVLDKMPEIQAEELKLALELFVKGSLDMFAKQTNVNTKSRLVAYGIAELGKEQAGIGMLIMLESIRARIAANAKKGRATWLYVEEFHNLATQEFSARYLEKIWKEVRKLGGLCTAITQNIADLTASKVVETMLCNSEYISFLNQSELEIEILHNTLGISDRLLEYVHNTHPGCGLLKFGDRYIPKDNRLPKDSAMYKLFNTNFHEIQEMKQKSKLKQEVKEMAAMRKRLLEE